MKSEEEINERITDMTMKIAAEFPELSKYITEMTVTIPNKKAPEINIKNLEEYYNSLESLLKKYTKTHTQAKNENQLNIKTTNTNAHS